MNVLARAYGHMGYSAFCRGISHAGWMAVFLTLAAACTGCDALAPETPQMQAVWKVRLPGRNKMFGMHALDSAALYVEVRGRFTKLDARTGEQRWSVPNQLITAAPAKLLVRGGLLLVPSSGGVVAYRTSDGTVAWQRPLPGELATFSFTDERALYVPDWQGSLTAVSLADGAVRWRWEDTTTGAARAMLFAAYVADSIVYAVGRQAGRTVSGTRGLVLALDAVTGRERHRFLTPELGNEFLSVRSDGRSGLILGNGGSSGVDDLDPVTWTFRWRVSRADRTMFPETDLALRDGVLYVGWSNVVAIDVATGRELWGSATGGTTFSTVACGRQVVAQHYNLSFFDRATGRREALNDWTDNEFPFGALLEDGERVYAFSANYAYAFPCRR